MGDETTVETAETALAPVVPASALPKEAGQRTADLPALVKSAGPSAAFVWDEFFAGEVRNPIPAPPTRERSGSSWTGAPPPASKIFDA